MCANSCASTVGGAADALSLTEESRMSQRRIAACLVVALAVVAACADSGTGVEAGAPLQGGFALQTVDGTPVPIAQRKIVSIETSGTTTSSCTDYVAAISIDVSASGSATRGESHNLVC